MFFVVLTSSRRLGNDRTKKTPEATRSSGCSSLGLQTRAYCVLRLLSYHIFPFLSNRVSRHSVKVQRRPRHRRGAWAKEVSAFNWDIFYSTRPACVLPADVDSDGDVDIGDIMLVASRWHTSCETPDPDSNPATPNYEAHCDLNDDCSIDIADIMLVAVNRGERCG